MSLFIMSGLLICIVFSMITTGLSLLCVHCSNRVNASCTGLLKNCSQDERCVSTIKQTIFVGGMRTRLFERGCGPVDQCNSSSSLSSMVSIYYRRTCCSTNSCTPALPVLPNVTKSFNHIQCPMCLSHNLDCSASKLNNCTGNEFYCISHEIENYAKTYIRGCATESFCQGVQGINAEIGKGLSTSTNCLRSSSHPPAYPSLVWLFVVLLGKVHCLI